MEDQLHHTFTDSQFSEQKQLIPKDSSSLNIQNDQMITHLINSNLPIFLVFQHRKTINHSYKPANYKRKDKSLEELSKRFIYYFEGKNNNILEIDKVTEELGVQRRRMYDIINILESLGAVVKYGKNKYQWKGLSEVLKTIKRYEKQQGEGIMYTTSSPKKEKSLQFLATRFLNLFLHVEPAISLEHAIRQLIKNADQILIKAKIRRLYDIVNVFKSLGLVKKVHLANKKPGFQWMGTQYIQSFLQSQKIKALKLTNLERVSLQKQEKIQNSQTNYLEQFCKVIDNKGCNQAQQKRGRQKIEKKGKLEQLFLMFNTRQSAFSLVKK